MPRQYRRRGLYRINRYRPRTRTNPAAVLTQPSKPHREDFQQHRSLNVGRNQDSVEQHTVFTLGDLQRVCPGGQRPIHNRIAVIVTFNHFPLPYALGATNIIRHPAGAGLVGVLVILAGCTRDADPK